MKAIIFDIDGTLADLSHRLHYIKDGNRDWPSFLMEVHKDKPIEEVVLMYKVLEEYRANKAKRYGNTPVHLPYALLVVSARDGEVFAPTVKWLKDVAGIVPDKLYMRARGDTRQDSVVKQEILERIKLDGYEPFIVFDDRQRVVDMWRANGIRTFQVAPNFDDPL